MKEVAAIAVKKDGLLLMGRRRDNGRWTTPGGHLEEGEDPREGAARELFEEAGLKVSPSQLKPLSSREVKPRLLVHGFTYEPKGEVRTSMKEDPDQEVKRWYFVDPGKIKDGELHVPRKDNVLINAMEKKAMRGFWQGFEKRASETAEKTDPALWERAKEKARQRMGGKHSARAMQLAVQLYKKDGGGYRGKKPGRENSLEKWQQEKWQPNPHAKRPVQHLAQNRDGLTTRYLPEKKWQSLSKEEARATDSKKIKASKRGQQFVKNTAKAEVRG